MAEKEKSEYEKAADEAMKEFKVDWSAQQVAEWMAKWTPKAGIRHLARRMMSAFGLRWT